MDLWMDQYQTVKYTCMRVPEGQKRKHKAEKKKKKH